MDNEISVPVRNKGDMSWSRSIQFKRIRKHSACVFTEPDLESYEKAKKITLVRRNHRRTRNEFVDIEQKELLQAKGALPTYITRVWNELFSRKNYLCPE